MRRATVPVAKSCRTPPSRSRRMECCRSTCRGRERRAPRDRPRLRPRNSAWLPSRPRMAPGGPEIRRPCPPGRSQWRPQRSPVQPPSQPGPLRRRCARARNGHSRRPRRATPRSRGKRLRAQARGGGGQSSGGKCIGVARHFKGRRCRSRECGCRDTHHGDRSPTGWMQGTGRARPSFAVPSMRRATNGIRGTKWTTALANFSSRPSPIWCSWAA